MSLLLALLLALPQGDARTLVEKLDSDRIDDREQAERDLPALGKAAIVELRRAQTTATGEYAIRIGRTLRRAVLAEPTEEKLLETIPPGPIPRTILFSDAGHVATVPGPDEKRVVLDGVAGEPYDHFGHICFTPDGRTLTYLGFRNEEAFVFAGGRTFGPYAAVGSSRHEFQNPVVVSPDGKRVAFRARQGDARFVVVDGKPQTAYDDVDNPVFSPDSSRLAYAANRGGVWKESIPDIVGGKWFIVVDGTPGEEFDSVVLTSDLVFPNLSPLFNRDGSRMAYRAGLGKKHFVVVDGKRERDADHIHPMAFSPNGKRLAYVAVTGKSWTLMVDGQPTGDFDAVSFDLAFSPDSRRVAFPAKVGEKWGMVVDGVRGELFDIVSSPCFSPDGKRVAYTALSGGKRLVVVDGKKGPPFDFVAVPRFEHDGSDVFYTVRDGGKSHVVRGGKKGEGFDMIFGEDALLPGPVHRSPASSTLVYRALVGREWFIVIGDRKVGPFEQVSDPRFSPDGRVVMFGARKDRELWWRVVQAP